MFYFSCDCGSKAFFDSLGWPWPVHDCVNNILRQVESNIAEEYAKRIAERQERLRRGWKKPIRACNPREGETVEGVGVIRELLMQIDVFKKFNIPFDGSSIAVKFLGDLAYGNWTQVTIHVNDLDGEEIKSYTILARTDTWNQVGARRVDLVHFTAVGQLVPGRQPYWRCTSVALA